MGFNESFRLLQKTLACSSNIEAVLDTLHPDMRFALTYCAQEHADKRGHLGTLTSTDIESGARAIVDRLSVKRGRPKDHVLRFHIEGMMALLHDSCGIAVKAALVRADTYAPQATNGLGQLVVDSFRNANPALTETTIVNMMIEARHKHARKLLRFENYFPGYGATVTPF